MNEATDLVPVLQAAEIPVTTACRLSRASLDTPLSAEAKQWMEESRQAIDEFNTWYAANGSPLDQFRTF